jgi:hypothetical protein
MKVQINSGLSLWLDENRGSGHRQSSFVYQGRSVDARQIGRELGVRYIVAGSLRPVDQPIASARS